MEDIQEIKKRIGVADAAGALAAAKAAVRSSPSDPSSRSALFSLFAVHGEWARAAEQLDTAIRLGGDLGLAVYDIILKTIPDREKVMRGEVLPNFPGGDEPPEWFPAWQAALAALHQGDDAPLAEAALARAGIPPAEVLPGRAATARARDRLLSPAYLRSADGCSIHADD